MLLYYTANTAAGGELDRNLSPLRFTYQEGCTDSDASRGIV